MQKIEQAIKDRGFVVNDRWHFNLEGSHYTDYIQFETYYCVSRAKHINGLKSYCLSHKNEYIYHGYCEEKVLKELEKLPKLNS